MDIPTLKSFFMWCTIINVGLLLFWTLMYFVAKDLVYRIQSKIFPLQKETFTVVFYCFLGLYKIFVMIFNIVPFIALSIIG
jgi:hypothetical protein